MGDFIGAMLASVVFSGLYSLPALLATWRRHPQVIFIWLINVFAGWTIVGWIAALIWTLNPPKGQVKQEPNKQGIMIAGGILIALSVLSALAPKSKTTDGDDKTVVAAASSSSSSTSSATSSSAAEAGAGEWVYHESEDKMRGTKTQFASVSSDNRQTFSFPYKGGLADLTVRRTGKALDVIVEIEGQFTCNAISDDTVAVKFDDGPIVHYACADAADGSSNVLFIRNEAAFVAKLKKAKHVVIEAEFFQEGRRQMEFTVGGLNFQ